MLSLLRLIVVYSIVIFSYILCVSSNNHFHSFCVISTLLKCLFFLALNLRLIYALKQFSDCIMWFNVFWFFEVKKILYLSIIQIKLISKVISFLRWFHYFIDFAIRKCSRWTTTIYDMLDEVKIKSIIPTSKDIAPVFLFKKIQFQPYSNILNNISVKADRLFVWLIYF